MGKLIQFPDRNKARIYEQMQEYLDQFKIFAPKEKLMNEERPDVIDSCLGCDGNCCPCSPVLDDDYDDDDEVEE